MLNVVLSILNSELTIVLNNDCCNDNNCKETYIKLMKSKTYYSNEITMQLIFFFIMAKMSFFKLP